MKKLKELLGNKNVQVMTGGFIRYVIIYALLQFMKPWIVTLIYVPFALFISFCILFAKAEDDPKRDPKSDLSYILFITFSVCLPLSLAQMTLYCVAFRYLGIVCVPALTLAQIILHVFVEDDEDLPRTKTSSPDREEESSNEVHSLDGTAQTVPDHGVGSDLDGDPKIEARS